jgi:hypothetical protein
MNLLPTKSWNVWNVDNKQKVARDEQEHKEKLEAEEERKQKVNSERRIEMLRERARAKSGYTPKIAVEDAKEKPLEHITLFTDFAEDSLALSRSSRKAHNDAVCNTNKNDDEDSMKKRKTKREDVLPQGVRFGELQEYKGRNGVPRYHTIVHGTKIEEETKKRKREEEPTKKNKKKKTIEELRQERIEREAKERARAKKLL